jgi:hypothetical protein
VKNAKCLAAHKKEVEEEFITREAKSVPLKKKEARDKLCHSRMELNEEHAERSIEKKLETNSATLVWS